MILICAESLIKMGLSSGFDNTLAKSDNESRECVWSEEHDRIPLKQRLKILLASKHLLDLGEAKTEEIASVSLPPIDIIAKKEDEHCDSQAWMQGFHFACSVGKGSVKRLSLEQSLAGGPDECNRQEFAANNCICSNQITSSEINGGFVRAEKVGASDDTSLQHSMAIEVKTEIPDDFLDDLDHIVLKERHRMLLSRKSLELTKHITEGNFLGLSSAVVEDMIQHDAGIGKEESHSGGKESSMEGNHSDDIPEGNTSVLCKTMETGSSNGMITGSSGTNPQCPALARRCQGTKPGNFANIHQNEWICSSKKTSTEFESCGGKVFLSGNHNTILSSALPTFANVKSEPLDYNELQSPDKSAVGNSCFADITPVKSELEIADESVGDKVDHMLLRERMKLMASREVPDSDVYGKFECSRKILPSTLDCRPIVSESGKPPRVKRLRKRRKTATDSVETALEEDAPGLLQVLIDKGVLVDEIKLYGEIESSDVLDDSLTEESFTDLEAVISKLFSERSSLLKFAPIRCTKGEKASYCLACLISLVEQARYLQFRKWPIEWGWCRDLQSFIFVFERHNRIVLERPEYGYATYFFELVDSLPTDWQVKRLITAMKLTSCSRATLIENRALMVGEDLTKDEARVLTEYGWVPNSGLGTMLNYRDRVVHDRKNERDSSEWRSKIGKLLVDGYNGGTIVSADLPKKVVEYGVADSPQIKLEL